MWHLILIQEAERKAFQIIAENDAYLEDKLRLSQQPSAFLQVNKVTLYCAPEKSMQTTAKFY